MKLIKLSLQEFAKPSPMRGSIEPSSGMGGSFQKGMELHQVVQKLRQEGNPEYESERSISWTFERGDHQFEVSGRMDGFIPGKKPTIEEIKSSFNIFELARSLKDKRLDHPYNLQLLSYGHFYWLNYGIRPELNFYLISTRRMESHEFNLRINVREYEDWLNHRLDELVLEAKRAEKQFQRRTKLSKNIIFPFEKPRRGQMELIDFVEKGMVEGKRLMIQAPTGLGKTMGVLYPALKDSLSRGQRVTYITPKNSQHGVAEEAIERISTCGQPIKSLTITAKSKICMKAEPICNPEYCEYARDYYDKLNRHHIRNELAKKKKLTSKVMKNLASKYEVCPFELQIEAIEEADVIVCDYNYVFNHQSALARMKSVGFKQEGKPNLIIDEAHNLPARTMGNFSPILSSVYLENLMEEMRLLPKNFSHEGKELIHLCLETIKEATPSEIRTKTISLEIDNFFNVNEDLKGFLSRYLESDVEIRPRDVVLRLVFYWGEFVEKLMALSPEQTEFFITGQNDGKNRFIKIICCDASKLIQERYEHFHNVIAFSATLQPFSYYAQLMGLSGKDLIQEEFESPFNKENRKILIIPQISTKYSQRQKNYPKITETIERVVSLRKGNYLAFFPSFDFLDKALACFKVPSGFKVIKQNRYMKNSEVEEVLEHLKSQSSPSILFAVQGGVFSEGIDYVGNMVIGAFVVGPALPNFDFEREKMKEYYEDRYNSGFDYAYAFPAMAKAVQSAGRVIRSESDKGVIILMDDRFLEKNYGLSLPKDWFLESPKELVSNRILNDVNEFWERS